MQTQPPKYRSTATLLLAMLVLQVFVPLLHCSVSDIFCTHATEVTSGTCCPETGVVLKVNVEEPRSVCHPPFSAKSASEEHINGGCDDCICGFTATPDYATTEFVVNSSSNTFRIILPASTNHSAIALEVSGKKPIVGQSPPQLAPVPVFIRHSSLLI